MDHYNLLQFSLAQRGVCPALKVNQTELNASFTGEYNTTKAITVSSAHWDDMTHRIYNTTYREMWPHWFHGWLVFVRIKVNDQRWRQRSENVCRNLCHHIHHIPHGIQNITVTRNYKQRHTIAKPAGNVEKPHPVNRLI